MKARQDVTLETLTSPRPDDCEIPRAGYATWSCRCICDILVWQNHHVKDILCHVKWPWSIVNAIQARPTTGIYADGHVAWPTTETYDMAGKHWLNTISFVVRWCSTADVATPRPREVGGACRRQVLAGARTQETVGGPNGAQRSEFRRTAPPDGRYGD